MRVRVYPILVDGTGASNQHWIAIVHTSAIDMIKDKLNGSIGV